MLAMLVVITALAMLSFVDPRTANEHQVAKHTLKIFSEDDMTPDFTEQLGSHDHTTDIKKRSDVVKEKKQEPLRHAVNTNSTDKPVKNSIAPKSLDVKKGHRVILRQDTDVYDREDHVTQYLSDHLVNTDSEITSLQASDNDDREILEVKEDWFFAFLTGQAKAVDVEGALWKPADVNMSLEHEDRHDNGIPYVFTPANKDITDMVYKH